MANDTNDRDWMGMPEELLHLIYKKLPDIRDFIRFRTVCKSWYSSAPLSDPPEQQLPWLLDAWYDNAYEGSQLRTKHKFYSLSNGAVGSFHIEPHYRGKLFCGACREYLLLGYEHKKYYEGESFALFNPITNSFIRLSHMPESFFLDSCRSFASYFPILTNNNDPISKESIAIFVDTHYAMGRPTIYNLHSKEWVAVNYHYHFTTSCYMKGMFFATSLWFETCIFCVKSLQLLHKVPPPMNEEDLEPKTVYLIACSELILRVCWLEELSSKSIEECKFLIHRLDYDHVGGVHHNWVQISNIGDQMLFLDEYNGFSACARSSDGFKGNCIYFLYPWPCGRPYRYDITSGTVEQVPCPFRECRWFIPGLH